MDDATFDAAALAILRPSWDDRDRYATPELQVKALRSLADRRAASRSSDLVSALATAIAAGRRTCS
jgi:hypothetical protein